MIAVDTHILVYAHREEMPLHKKALSRLRQMSESAETWALPIFCITEFLRVVTHPKLFDPPTTIRIGISAIDGLIATPNLSILRPGKSFWRILMEIAQETNIQGNLIYDAQIAAVCMEHGVNIILTEDRHFSRFDSIIRHTL